MNTADVGYMYNLVLWRGFLSIVGAPTSLTEREFLNGQGMYGGTVLFDTETYDEAEEMLEYLNGSGDLPDEDKFSLAVCMDIQDNYYVALDAQRNEQ